MKRNPDLERKILLAVEAYDGVSEPYHAEVRHLASSHHVADYHVLLLAEAGLIAAEDVRTPDDPYEMWPTRLTMAGHEYLDTIRDEEVWRRTKEGARAVGSFSLDALGALARGLVREKIRKHTGVEVDL
ncbi:DUF2513 domain-containing protein [uncultured Jannaschia sp.]|uniref:DUF2513 domain-containing protein n=1 Tax=uncultured Jannaschia sp. TaxID=293347 RepID=UPI002613BE2F|nr:DUF2513 domain-containing protein [uncultured Jannaschia sp.]